MDDTQKQQQQNQQSATSQTVVQFPQTTQQPVVPTGSMVKEAEPMPSVLKPVETVKPAEAPVELPKEVEAAGVKEIKSMPQIPQEVRQLGVQHAAAATPVSTQPSGFIKLPMTKEEAQAKVKGNFLFKNPSESFLWLAMLIVRQFQMKEKEKQKG
ncbi:MAG TPA: hypothetical protein VF820_02285 [Patescibacteria group bacterium]